MNQNTKIAILGGGGRTGKFLVSHLLQQGYYLKLLLRHPENFTLESSQIEIIAGDAVHLSAIYSLLQDCDAVISTLGQRPGEPMVASQATAHILAAMAHCHIKRYIAVAGLNVDTPSDQKSPQTIQATDWMKTNFPLIHADRQKAYSILAASPLDWTLVRVPFIQFTEANGKIAVDLTDCPGTEINAGDIATFLTEQLLDNTYFQQSPFIANA